MTALRGGNQPALGLRERKKAKTRAAIQRHALRLFREQGYEATTVEQIAEAAEVSPSTFFRYFRTKEEVALYDDLDPLFIAAFEAQPAELSPVQAMRQTWNKTYELAFNSKNKFMIRTFALVRGDRLADTLPEQEAKDFAADDM